MRRASLTRRGILRKHTDVRRPNMRVQRTRSSPSALRSPLMRCPLGAGRSEQRSSSSWIPVWAAVVLIVNFSAPLTASAATSPSGACHPEVLGPEPYEQRVTATPLHCSKPAGQCGGNREESVAYVWPAKPLTRAPRIAFLKAVMPFLSPPVDDPAVRLLAGWLYEPGRWHMATDYGIDGTTSFTALAAAPGRVIFVGWDGFSGNTVIVSHDVGGAHDAYRTIYMHLRNGATHDCASSWSESVSRAPQGSPMLAAYKAQLERTGCSEVPSARRPDPRFWGTDNDRMALDLLGQQVTAGAVLGKAGDTGPGGFATAEDPNVHLHVFFARRAPPDSAWVLFDPWGVYGVPSCYPSGVSRGRSAQEFPSAWK
jgi:hypothetical protein